VATTMEPIRWDPYNIEIDLAPYDTWRRMRDEAPLYRNEALDFWALSRYEDVLAASRDVATFSSAQGTVLEMMGNDMTASSMIIFMDPPSHTAMRALVSRAFTPRRMAALEDSIREICAEYLDPQIGSGGFDFLADFGTHLPSRVISALLGVPLEEREYVLNLINTVFYIDAEKGMVNDISITATFELMAWISAAIEKRMAHPTDDMLSALGAAEMTEDGVTRKLTLEEMAAFGVLLVSAGTETVARLLGWTVTVLAKHPNQRAELVADNSLIPNAVEELLRYEAPSPVNGRTVMQEVTMHGQTLPVGSKVLLLTGSAGRDEREYADPDRFDIHRRTDQHVTFGVGAHYCLGAALARLEGKVALEEVLRRFPEWTVDEANVQRLHTSTVRGHKSVPILIPG
jgi:cytochrome P450